MSGKEYSVRFAQGSASTYLRNLPLFEQTVYFATDTEQLYLNGIKYGGANREIPVEDGAYEALMYFMEHQDDIMSGKIPNVVLIRNGNSGNGHAIVVYDSVDDWRVDYYLSVDLSSSSKQGLVRKHTYALFKGGLFYPEMLDAFEYSFIPHLSESNPTTDLHDDFYGLYETWIESTNGAITKHYWDGTKYVNTLLPTSKNVALETICTYVYSFGTTPMITYGPDSITAASVFTLERMQMDGIQTQLFCVNNWLVKNGKLITYADGARPMLLLNQDGKDLEVGEQVKIDCSDNALIDEVQTTGFTWSYSDNVYTLTKKHEGRQFIYLNRGKYISSISYYRAGMSKTFTVSTPDGVREITVLNDPGSFVDSITALESRFPVGTADISDKSITKEKLAFDIAVDISAETVANINTWINNAFK